MAKAYAFKLKFEALSPLLVGAGSVVGNIKESFKMGKYYVIPASSWKGALRREALTAAYFLNLDQKTRQILAEHLEAKGEQKEGVGFHDGKGCSGMPEIKSSKGFVDIEAARESLEPELYHLIHESMRVDEAEAEICAALKNFACPVDSIFGSMYFSSLSNFSSSVFTGRPEYRYRTSIDRLTMSVASGHLFVDEVVWPSSNVELYATLIVPDRKELYGYVRDPESITAVWKATLDRLSKTGVSLGSGKSYGLGLLRLKPEESTFLEVPEKGEGYKWSSLDEFLA